jgi:hypothetical protein
VAPVAQTGPVVSGTPQPGSTLTASSGTWSGNPTAYWYQWLRCDATGASCAPLAGAVGTTYTPTTTDVGSVFSVQVTAANEGAEAVASAHSSVVSTVPPLRVQDTTALVTGTSVTATLPAAPAPGDLLVALVSAVGANGLSSTLQAPTGWTKVGSGVDVPGLGGGIAVLWRIAQAGDSATSTFAKSGLASGMRVHLFEYRAAAGWPANPVAASNSGSTAGGVSITSGPLAATGSRAGLLFAGVDVAGPNTTFANAWPAGYRSIAADAGHVETAESLLGYVFGPYSAAETWVGARSAALQQVVFVTN